MAEEIGRFLLPQKAFICLYKSGFTMTIMLTEIIKRALVETVLNIGQLSAQEKRQLDAAVKKGYLSKGKGGPFPALKTVYAMAGFDFIADRNAHIEHAMALAELDRVAAEGKRANASR